MNFRPLTHAALLASFAAQAGCVGDFPAASPADLTDARPPDRGVAPEAGPRDADTDAEPVPDDATLDADADADADAEDLGLIFDVGFLDLELNPEAGRPDGAADDLGPPDVGPQDLDLPDQGAPLLGGVDDVYILNGACAFTRAANLGVLANDDAPPGATVELVGFDLRQGALALSPDGAISLLPDRAQNVRFTYRWVLGNQRSAPIEVELQQPPGAIVVDEASDGAQNGGCSLRSAIRAASTDSVVQGCRAGQGADVIVFDQLATTTTFDAFNREPNGGGLTLTVEGGETRIFGCGAEHTIIDGNGLDRVFDVRAGAGLVLHGVTVRGGWAQASGAGLLVRGTAELFDTVVEGHEVEGVQGGLGTRMVGDAIASTGGGGGGGGGAGIGGGVMVVAGATFRASGTPETCIFRNNRAIGGGGGAGVVANPHPDGAGGRGGGSGNSGGLGGLPGGFPAGQLGAPGAGGGGGAGQANPGPGGPGGLAGGGGGGGARLGPANERGAGAAGGLGGFGAGRGGVGGCRSGGPGGGGAGIGGALYNDNGSVTVTGCRFAGNQVEGGAAGALAIPCEASQPAVAGQGLAPTVFTRGNGVFSILNEVVVEDGAGATLRCAELAGCP